MLLRISNLKKELYKKTLLDGATLYLEEGDKSALIGRNGSGKTTLFKIIQGVDKDYTGNIELNKNISIVATSQEHINISSETTAIEYILESVPNYNRLHKIVYQKEDASEEYLDAISKFSDLGYFNIQDDILQKLSELQIDETRAISPLKELSGGEKRFVELVRVLFSKSDLALIDEPTNHMDMEGKQKFIDWIKKTKMSLIIITHDRDVLMNVTKIYEIKDQYIFTYKGNYNTYLEQNSANTVSKINDFEIRSKQMAELQKKIDDINSLGTISQALKIRRERFQRELNKLSENLNKPSVWIDQTSLGSFTEEVISKYHEYKDRNIEITNNKDQNKSNTKKILINCENIILGYTNPLFNPINFQLHEKEKIQLLGRNGVGKTTFIKYLISSIQQQKPESNLFQGEIKLNNGVILGIYEQEISPKHLEMTLEQAIIDVYVKYNKVIGPAIINSILATYLFNKELHKDMQIKDLSGGEKARFQLIKLLANDPNLIILDEPTNHLDLPSVEELENFLLSYKGACIFVSHDSFFSNKLNALKVELNKFIVK